MEHRNNNSNFPTRNWKVSFYTVIDQFSRVGTLAHYIFIIFNPLLSKGSIARDTPQKPAILHSSLRYASTKNKPYAQ